LTAGVDVQVRAIETSRKRTSQSHVVVLNRSRSSPTVSRVVKNSHRLKFVSEKTSNPTSTSDVFAVQVPAFLSFVGAGVLRVFMQRKYGYSNDPKFATKLYKLGVAKLHQGDAELEQRSTKLANVRQTEPADKFENPLDLKKMSASEFNCGLSGTTNGDSGGDFLWPNMSLKIGNGSPNLPRSTLNVKTKSACVPIIIINNPNLRPPWEEAQGLPFMTEDAVSAHKQYCYANYALGSVSVLEFMLVIYNIWRLSFFTKDY